MLGKMKKERNCMELIASFAVDHTKIVPGIFISRQDSVGGSPVTTYDVRMTRPNVEPCVSPAAMHSLEHLIATYLRNDPVWKDEVIYWGPMGCLTGFYLILKGGRAPEEIFPLLLAAFDSVADADSVPGTAPENCGSCLMHNLPMAQWHAARFAEYLRAHAQDPVIFRYPQTHRPLTDDGRPVFDS